VIISSRKAAAVATSAVLASVAFSGAAYAQPLAPASTSTVVQPMTSAKKTLHLPDGKRTAHVWKTWYKKSNGKYHGHYGFTSASKGVSVYVVLSGRKTRALSKGKHYSYTNESYVWLFACDNAYPNGDDCTTNW
jgi:hypothetical protein